MADAVVLAADENHRGRRDRGDLLCVVACTGHEAADGVAQVCGGLLDRVLDALIEGHRAGARHPLRLDPQAGLGVREGVEEGGEVTLGGLEVVVLRVAEVDRDLRAVGDDAGQSGRGGDVAHCPAQAPVPAGVDHRAHVDDDLRGGESGVDAQLRGGRARVGRAPVEGDALPGDRLHAGDDAQRHVLAQQHRALLDVALDVGVRRIEQDRRVAREPDALELVAEGQAVGIRERVGVLEADPAGGDGGAQHVRAEAHALLLREGGDDEGSLRRDPPIVQGADGLDAGQHAQAPVEGARGADGVDVGARHDGGEIVAQARAAAEDRAHRVDRHDESGLLHPPDDEATTGSVLIGEGLAVHTDEIGRLVVVRADRRELHEVRPEAVAIDREDRRGEGRGGVGVGRGGVGRGDVHAGPFEGVLQCCEAFVRTQPVRSALHARHRRPISR